MVKITSKEIIDVVEFTKDKIILVSLARAGTPIGILIKRFLNAYEMRSGLLAQSGVIDSKSRFALLKLMLIEQKYESQFKQLYSWTISNIEAPEELRKIEAYAEGLSEDISELKDWNVPELLKLVSTEPKFSSVDMKELFWVSRDNLVDEMSGQSLVPAKIRALFMKAYNASSDPIRKNVCEKDISLLSLGEIEDFFDLLDSKILTSPNDKVCYLVYYFCIMHGIERAYNRLLDILTRIDTSMIPYSLGNKFKDILEKYSNDKKLFGLIKPNAQLVRSITGKEQKKN